MEKNKNKIIGNAARLFYNHNRGEHYWEGCGIPLTHCCRPKRTTASIKDFIIALAAIENSISPSAASWIARNVNYYNQCVSMKHNISKEIFYSYMDFFANYSDLLDRDLSEVEENEI